MTDAGYSLLSVFKSKLFYIIGLCLTTIIFVIRVLTVPTYLHFDVVAEVYPVQMVAGETPEASINPCYKMRRALESEEFKNKLVNCSNGVLSDANFHSVFKFYETPQHTMLLHLYVDDTLAGLRLMSDAVALMKQTYDNYPSSLLEMASGGHLAEASVADYHWDTIDTLFVADIIDHPYVVSSPKPMHWVKTFLLAVVFSFCSSAALLLLVTNLRKR